MATHIVRLTVVTVMEEMDGTPRQSAEIAMEIIEELLDKHFPDDATVEVEDYTEVE